MEKGQIVYKAKEVICLHCGEKQSLTSTNYAEWLDECVLFREEHKSCRKQELGKMTFEQWWEDVSDVYFDNTGTYPNDVTKSFSKAAWEVAQAQAKDAPSDAQQKLDKLTEHIANLEAEVALLNNAVSAQPTLRDQFAMAALSGMLSLEDSKHHSDRKIALLAYRMADEMLKEREK